MWDEVSFCNTDLQLASGFILPTFFVVQLLNHVWHFATPWTAACQASLSFTMSQSLLKLVSTESMMPSNYLILCHPLLLCPQSFPASGPFPLHKIDSLHHQVAKVLELQLQHQSFQWIFRTDFLWDGLAWSPCRPKDSQESSPAPQFESINSSNLSLLYGPTLKTTVHDYWKEQNVRGNLSSWDDKCQLLKNNCYLKVKSYVLFGGTF